MALVSTHFDDRIAIVTIDNPPVSTGNARLRGELHNAFLALESRDDVQAVVLRSAQAHFYSGSDIKEFDGEILPPSLPEVIETISGLRVPVVAALNGSTLGGGLEVALACDVRIAERGARLGLPEVTLGMLPGAGGTVRLPRLVGLLSAIDIIGSGRPINADAAVKAGLVDVVVDPDRLDAAAIDAARHAVKRRATTLVCPPADPAEVNETVARITRNGRARPNVLRAIELVRSGVEQDPDLALASERAAFDELRVGAEARNLRYLFFAKRDAAKDLSTGGPKRQVATIAIVGAGTMGAAIAVAALSAGLDVTLVEPDDAARERASARLAENLPGSRGGRLTVSADIASVADVDVVLDAVFEDMAVKQDLFRSLEQLVPDNTILASNTSYLNLDEISDVLRLPGRFIGLHFFAPADRNPLLEVVRTASTTDDAVTAAAAVVRKLRKTPILANVGEGFVANRVYADYRVQAEFLVEDGASPEEVDAAIRQLGLPMGPFAVSDMSGLDIAWARRKRLAPTRDPRLRYVKIADMLCEAGRLGRKTAAGWFAYPDGATRGSSDPAVADLITEARSAKGIQPRDIPADEIQRRIICAMVAAAAEVVSTGVAQRASDVDVALTEGFGFPKHLGGPLRFAAAQPPDWLIRGLAEVRDSDVVAYDALLTHDGQISERVQAVLDAVRA
jgi:3-hydroxyacyl-CoA dehydrogenase